MALDRDILRLSKTVGEVAKGKALLQASVLLPIFALTKRGKEIIIEKIRQSDEQVLVKHTRLPCWSPQRRGRTYGKALMVCLIGLPLQGI